MKENPLADKRILVTAPVGTESLQTQLRVLGVEVIERPAMTSGPPSDLRAFAELVQDAHVYDWIVFTTPQGVTAFFDLFYKLYDDTREIGGARFAALGAETAARLKDFHLHLDVAADDTAAGKLKAGLQELGGIENLRVLLVEAEEAQDVLRKELAAMGGIVDEGFAYRIEPQTREKNGAPDQWWKVEAEARSNEVSGLVEAIKNFQRAHP